MFSNLCKPFNAYLVAVISLNKQSIRSDDSDGCNTQRATIQN